MEKIGNQEALAWAPGYNDILRLDVAVNNPRRMGGSDSVAHLDRSEERRGG